MKFNFNRSIASEEVFENAEIRETLVKGQIITFTTIAL